MARKVTKITPNRTGAGVFIPRKWPCRAFAIYIGFTLWPIADCCGEGHQLRARPSFRKSLDLQPFMCYKPRTWRGL
jgi:hypothetical protein